MNSNGRELKIFTANSNSRLAQSVAQDLGVELGKSEVKRFSDGEISVSIKESVRGVDCFIIQSTCEPINDNLMELLLMIDAFKRASAGCITAVIPYFGYARQDRKAHPRDPISSKLVADLLTAAGVNRILTMDLHALQILGFFNLPINHLVGAPFLASALMKEADFDPQNTTVLAPDFGAVTRARSFAKLLGCPIALIDKRRASANVSEVMNIVGDVKDRKIVMIDDIIDTAGTMCNAADAVIDRCGAKEVCAYVTHGVLSGPAIKNLERSRISKVTMFNTIPISEEKMLDKFTVLNAAPILSEAIKRVHMNQPVSAILE